MKIHNYFTNIAKENISQEVRWKNIDETRNDFLEKIKQYELWKWIYKKLCTTLFLNLASTVNGCISISNFASLLGIPIQITTYAIGLKICAIAAGIKNYKSLIKKKKKKHNKYYCWQNQN